MQLKKKKYNISIYIYIYIIILKYGLVGEDNPENNMNINYEIREIKKVMRCS